MVEAAKRALHAPMPSVMELLYSTCDGCFTPAGVVLYPAGEIAERNTTWEVALYAPGFVAAGDDGGGRVLLVASNGEGVWVDSGSMDPGSGEPLGRDFVAWVEAGLPLSGMNDELPLFADVYLEAVPADGLRGLLVVKRELGLQVSPREMKRMLVKVPVRIQRKVPFGKALVRCRRINAGNECVGLRAVDDPALRLGDPFDAATFGGLAPAPVESSDPGSMT